MKSANNQTSAVHSLGNLHLQASLGEGSSRPITFKDSFAVPQFGDKTLLSIKQLNRMGHNVFFDNKGFCRIVDNHNKMVGVGYADLQNPASVHRLCVANHPSSSVSSSTDSTNVVSAKILDSLDVWHVRLGHANANYIRKALSEAGIQLAPNATLSFCGTCSRTKMNRTPLPARAEEIKASALWEVVAIDLGGPERKSPSGNRYPIFFTCEATQTRLMAPLKDRGQAQNVVELFLAYVDRQFGGFRLKSLRLDGELYSNHAFLESVLSRGIIARP